jgi:hypothetical protein
MAPDSGERRMVFDTRGRRKNVIRVVYAILALLMGASLFVAVGPFNIAELVGDGGSSSASEVLDEQSERIEGRLAKDPTNEQLLLALTRTRIGAGNAQIEPGTETSAAVVPAAAHDDFSAALTAWNSYLEQAGDEPNPSAAQLVAGTFFQLAESGSTTLAEIEENVSKAAEAQQIVAEQQPSVGSLSTLAIYEYFAGGFVAGDKATKQAMALAPSKAEAKSIEKQLDQYRKRAKQFVTQAEKIAKAQPNAGKEQLQNPLGGLGAGSTLGE